MSTSNPRSLLKLMKVELEKSEKMKTEMEKVAKERDSWKKEAEELRFYKIRVRELEDWMLKASTLHSDSPPIPSSTKRRKKCRKKSVASISGTKKDASISRINNSGITRSTVRDQQNMECRSNLARLAKICEAVGFVNANEKKEICKESDFYKLIGAPIKKKNNLVLFEAIADLYDIKTEAFLIKGRHLKMCAEEIAYLTGLPCEGKVYNEGRFSILPTYFVNLCKKFDKDCDASQPVSLKTMTEVIKKMTIESEDDQNDFRRLLNTMISNVVAVKSQGKIPKGCMVYGASLENFKSTNWPQTICNRIHSFMKERKVGKEKTRVTCTVQVVEAWFNMRTGRIQPEGNEEGDDLALAPMLSYLGVQFKAADVENVFQRIDCDKIINCRNPSCSSQERLLDDGDEQPFSYKCSTYVLSGKGEKIPQGDALEEEETQSEADAPKKTGEMTTAGLGKEGGVIGNLQMEGVSMSKSVKASLEKVIIEKEEEQPIVRNEETKKRGSSSDTASQTEAHSKRQKSARLSQDEDDAPKKTGKMAIAGSVKMRVGKEGGARKSAKANLKKKQRRHRVKYGEDLVNTRIQVSWPDDEKFYAGTVKAFDPETKKHEAEKQKKPLVGERSHCVAGDVICISDDDDDEATAESECRFQDSDDESLTDSIMIHELIKKIKRET